ncbi:MAG: hypothetical protein KDI33_13760 [Halioglobus sp.]|nr:hypothetical protein [Halioglobus sp.]
MILLGGSASASAITVNWTDWESSSSTNGYTALGTILSGSEVIGVTYNNPQGIGFDQLNGGTDYWQNNRSGRNPATSPYTSPELTNGVDNIPEGTDIIALSRAGLQTLSFSQTIANPFFSYVSLNGNGYAFDQDFELLSVGGVDGNDCGYWGCGTSYKEVADLGNGVFEYRLLGTGEPHGTLRFTGSFDTVTWRSLSNEFWNGFTVGVEGTQEQVFPCDVNPNLPECNPTDMPVPGTLLLLGLGLTGLRFSARKTLA